ncbi:hypothetical protein B0H19DRAFT_1211155 [Mycena capillaripes]|nr:hypothetical protein B0H19DRAFT_1211155 [Mycena capillaripes]
MADANAEIGLDAAIEHAKRAFALEKYEQAVEFYATALELITKKCGDDAPETADLYFSYGKALLENAISQSSVLGKDQPEGGADEPAESTSANGPILSFSGDAEDIEDPAVDLFSAVDEEDAAEEGEGGDDAEPEDDFNAAWEVLDLARAIYAKQTEDGADDGVRLKLADTYIALGDVSLETEKFDQAITDYEAGLKLKDGLLPRSSRQIAEAYYKLSMVLDLTSGRLGDAITHAERALESIDMSAAQREAETKELAGLKEDLALKVEELKTRPDEPMKNASALAAQALDADLNASGSSNSQVVNDLTAMVVKKKKPAPQVSGTKRKADDEGESERGKKVRLDDSES